MILVSVCGERKEGVAAGDIGTADVEAFGRALLKDGLAPKSVRPDKTRQIRPVARRHRSDLQTVTRHPAEPVRAREDTSRLV